MTFEETFIKTTLSHLGFLYFTISVVINNMKLKKYTCVEVLAVIMVVSAQCADTRRDWDPDLNSFQIELHAPPPQAGKVYWGAETNGVKAGLTIDYYSSQAFQYFSTDTDSIPIRCFPLLYVESTNNSRLLIFDSPPVKSRYRMELTDEKGNAVQKTAQGEALGKTAPNFYKPSPNPITGAIIDTGWRPARHILSPKEAHGIKPAFLLQDYFKITNSGKYHLHFEMCAFKLDANDMDKEELIQFPPVDAEIEIKMNR